MSEAYRSAEAEPARDLPGTMERMADEPARPTLGALRAAHQARRVATEIALDRVTGLGAVRCARCGRTIAVATDAAHPASQYDGRVVCRNCRKSARVARTLEYCDLPPGVYEIELPKGVPVWVLEPAQAPTLWQRFWAWVRRA